VFLWFDVIVILEMLAAAVSVVFACLIKQNGFTIICWVEYKHHVKIAYISAGALDF